MAMPRTELTRAACLKPCSPLSGVYQKDVNLAHKLTALVNAGRFRAQALSTRWQRATAVRTAPSGAPGAKADTSEASSRRGVSRAGGRDPPASIHKCRPRNDDWAHHLGALQFAFNNAKHSSTGIPPAQLLSTPSRGFGRLRSRRPRTAAASAC
jgi:hypothetical protein